MKKMNLFLLMVVLAVVMSPLSVFANGAKEGGVGKMEPDQERADKYAGYAGDYDSKADRYEKKAAGASGDKAAEYRRLAENFRGCAKQKRRMSKAYASGNHELLSDAGKEYARLCLERKSISSPFKDNKNVKKLASKSWCKTKDCKLKKLKKLTCGSSECCLSDKKKKAEQIEKRIKALQHQLEDIKTTSKPSSDGDFAF